MKKLYEKNELIFAITCITIFLASRGAVNVISRYFDVREVLPPIWIALLVAILCIFIFKNKLAEKYGLCKGEPMQKSNLYYIPLMLLVLFNLCFGLKLNYTASESILRIVDGVCVGFTEEVLFRGFLFKAILPKNHKLAIIISSGIFGFIHITNMILGADPIQTLLQICYATALGFLFSILFYKRKSLLPCIITHCLLNSVSVVANNDVWFASIYLRVLSTVFVSVVSVVYAIYIIKQDKKA